MGAITVSELLDKVPDFEMLSMTERIKFIAFFFVVSNDRDTFSAEDIIQTFESLNLSVPSNVHSGISNLLNINPSILVKKERGSYAFNRPIKQALEKEFLGVTPVKQVSVVLRDLVARVTNNEQSMFLKEAIDCFEIGAYRSAVIMSWVLALDIIYGRVMNDYLVVFNAELTKNKRYAQIVIRTKEDFSDIKERDLIELLRASGVISGDVRKILVDTLDVRNTCAHPNSIVIKQSKAVAVIDHLVENVVIKYQ